MQSTATSSNAGQEKEVGRCALRPLPYPYRAALAICSDLDGTTDWRAYWELARFLNTTAETVWGPGLGLEVGNSIYFDMASDETAYWNTDDQGRAMFRTLMQSGHIDCLHSYGSLAATRSHAQRALDELTRHGLKLKVWVDHGRAPTNFNWAEMNGHGDERGHEAYHADLTLDYGISYVCRCQLTSVVAQDLSPCLWGHFNWWHPWSSSVTMMKENAKMTLGQLGKQRYAMHLANRLLRRTQLRDGQPIMEFMRTNPCWRGAGACASGRGLANVLTSGVVAELLRRGGLSVLYTHLGKSRDGRPPLTPESVAALQGVAARARTGELLVTTTRRVLALSQAQQQLRWTARTEAAGTVLEVDTSATWPRLGAEDLGGLTFYVPEAAQARLLVDGQEISGLKRNPADATSRQSVSVPWRWLEFPSL